MVGIPFFAGFSVKLFMAVSAAEYGNPAVFAGVMAVLGISSVLNAMYFIRTVVLIYADRKDPAETEAGSVTSGKVPCGSATYYAASVILVLGNLFLGLFAPVSVNMIRQGLSMFQ